MTINRAREQPCASTIRGRRTRETATRLATSNGFRKYPPAPTTSTTSYKLDGPFLPRFLRPKAGFPSLESIRSFVLVFSKGHPQVRRSRPGLVQNGAGFANVSAPKANDQWRIVQSWGAIEEEGTLEYERC